MRAKEVIDKLRAKRQKFLDGLEANQGDINLDIFEDFYPDKAHFVFELLQNAEDTEATKCKFHLSDDAIEFRHNGKKRFSEADVKSITGIHNSTKTKQDNQIGKFGVGFKSVFIYTRTPEIHSGDYSFSIRDLVMPEPLDPVPGLGDWTQFRFPFNNPDKPPEASCKEIREGLEELSELTLLFLRNIESITWRIEGAAEGELLRIEHSEYHIEVLKQIDPKTASSSHFLKFSREIPDLEGQHVCIAFPLDHLPANPKNGSAQIHKQFKIVPAKPGRVSVFFPAEKETSGLRFHIHAPFVPTLDRSSIKEVKANEPLYEEIALLAAECLHHIRDLKLLTGEFLSILPNPQDEIPERYVCILDGIIKAMRMEPLTPMLDGGHAPAKHLIQARASLKRLLTPEDLEFLIADHEVLFRWAIAAQQRNGNADRLLNALEIRKWGVDQLVDELDARVRGGKGEGFGRDEETLDWLAGKSDEWMQSLYALLYGEYFKSSGFVSPALKRKIGALRIVKVVTGEHSSGEGCYFVSSDVQMVTALPCAAPETYTSGKNKNEQKDARGFLEEIGVREIGNSERIKLLLKEKYQDEFFDPSIEHLLTFINHYKANPGDAKLFKGYYIFLNGEGEWARAGSIYLDEPYTDTGLKEFYDLKGEYASRQALSEKYLEFRVEKNEIVNFAKATGAATFLDLKKTDCWNNPERKYLRNVAGEKFSSPINEDFLIEDFKGVFDGCTEQMSGIVWKTLCNNQQPPNHLFGLMATYQKNFTNGSRSRPSQFVYQLRDTAWVPQRGMNPVKPENADRDLLPGGFPFDSDWHWVKEVDFGSEVEKSEEEKTQDEEVLRQALGIDADANVGDALEVCGSLMKLSPEKLESFKRQIKDVIKFDLQESEVPNPELRHKRSKEEAANAPERLTEKRERSVPVGQSGVKQEAKEFLRQEYTNNDGEMMCQVCQNALPFKSLSDGHYYFEAVEFLPGITLKSHNNHLALCPNHAAMFKHANTSIENLKDFFIEMGDDDRSILVELAGEKESVHFTQRHQIDLTATIEHDQESNSK